MVKELATWWWSGEGEEPSLGHAVHPLSQCTGFWAYRSAQKTGFRKDILFSDIWPSILISSNTEIPLEREKERTEKPLKLLGETKTLIGLEDSWDVGGVVGGSEEGDAKDNTHFYNKTWLFLQIIVQIVQLWSMKQRIHSSLVIGYYIV